MAAGRKAGSGVASLRLRAAASSRRSAAGPSPLAGAGSARYGSGAERWPDAAAFPADVHSDAFCTSGHLRRGNTRCSAGWTPCDDELGCSRRDSAGPCDRRYGDA